MLHPENIGKRLGIDETMLHKDLMTFLTNKEGHGKRHTLIAAVKGTKASDIINVLMQIPQEQREQVEDLCNCAILPPKSIFLKGFGGGHLCSKELYLKAIIAYIQASQIR